MRVKSPRPIFLFAMRVIAGTYRSRTLKAPPGLATRPTSDRLRETLFNVLAPRIVGAVFLDLYAGSGAVGIEALSRGATHVVFVERSPAALKVLDANLASLAIKSGIEVENSSVGAYLRRALGRKTRFDLVFLDPPYDAAADYENTLSVLGAPQPGPNLVVDDGLIIAEHRGKVGLKDQYGALIRTRLLEQGDASLSFYAAAQSAAGA